MRGCLNAKTSPHFLYQFFNQNREIIILNARILNTDRQNVLVRLFVQLNIMYWY